jgi:predicted DNA-binding transcriptional regulator YafY
VAKIKRRTDAERRARQCERMSRLLRMLKLIMGPGRWDAEGLARELECSRRTVHRDLQTLSMAGVPWQYDEQCRAYRVMPGFRFPAIGETVSPGIKLPASPQLLQSAKNALRASETLSSALRQLCEMLEQSSPTDGR